MTTLFSLGKLAISRCGKALKHVDVNKRENTAWFLFLKMPFVLKVFFFLKQTQPTVKRLV